MSDGGSRTPDSSTEEVGFLPAILTDLPPEVLTCIMGLVNDVVDLVFLVCTCRQFRDLARVVPFSVKCRPKHPPSSRAWTRAVLKSVRCCMLSTRVLDMAGTWVVDDDVAALLADLKNLDSLILDGCQKLTSSVADTLAVSVRSGPQTVSLQRCFGIGPTAAGNLLAAAAVNGSRLQCILFSHLDRLDIPRDISLNEIEGTDTETSKGLHPHKLNMSISAGVGLHILALNNCASIGPFDLETVATTCPLLEVLMLGGSVEGFYLSRFENLSQERVQSAASALVKAAEHLPSLRVLEITFFSSSVAQFVRTSSVADTLAVSVRSGPQTVSLQRCFGIGPTAAGNLLAAAAVNGSRLQCILFSHLDRLDIPRDISLNEIEGTDTETSKGLHPHKLNMSISAGVGLHILALNNCASIGPFDLETVATTCPLLEVLMLGGSVEGFYLSRFENLSQERVQSAASALVKAAEHLPSLRVLEITFFSSSVAQFVREEIKKDIEVWDFREESSVMSAILYLGGSKCFQEKRKSKVCKEDMVFAVYAAANCSDTRRRTPLHVAAASGCAQTVQCLLALGAEAKGMKDSGGATALFVAAECGYANICELLLQAGADVLAGNRAGENPLYIAALRGHCAAVEVLVRHCFKNNINWQCAKVYGDGWTPLMAAAVADRQDVAKILLKAIEINISTHLNENTFSESAICALNDKRIHIGSDERDIYTSTICRILQEHHSTLQNFQNNLDSKQNASTRNQLLDAQNRYGQTALHIAARRASLWFVCNLIIAGASTDIHDGYSMRAIDVAYHQNHEVVASIIKKWDAVQKQPLPKIKECRRSKHEQYDNDANISSAKSQSNKTKNVTSGVHKSKRNAATIVSGKLPEEHGRSFFARHSWRVKGSQKGAVPHTESSSGT